MKTVGNTSAVRAGLYARVSSDQQELNGTIASQLAALRQRLQDDGLAVEDELCFVDDGYTGSTLLRPALERLRDMAASGGVDRLYVHSPDRLARKYAYQVLLIEELQRAGVEMVFLNRALGPTPEDELLLQVQGVVAEYERAKILERSRRGKQHAARCGCVQVLGGAPYGYRYIRKQEGGGAGRYEIVWEEARVVQAIFTWVGQERLSLNEVVRRLARQGIPTRTGKTRWHPRTIWGLLTNPAFKGTAQFGKTRVVERKPQLRPARGRSETPRWLRSSAQTPEEERIAIAVPALISEALFATVAEQLAENQKRNRPTSHGPCHLLQGLVVCSLCGYALVGKSQRRTLVRGEKRQYRYYTCSAKNPSRFGGQGECLCPSRPVQADCLDAAVWQDVGALLADPQQIENEYEKRLGTREPGAEAPANDGLAKRIQQVKRGIARLIDGYENGLLDKGEFEPRIRSAKERLTQLETAAKVQTDAAAEAAELRLVIGHVQAFADRVKEGIDEADWPTRRELIRALVKRIEVGQEKIRVVYRVNVPPFVKSPAGGISQDCLWRRGRRRRQLRRRPGPCKMGTGSEFRGACPHFCNGL